MNFTAGGIILDIVTGSVGFVLFVYGKKQDRWPQLIAGLLYMVYPFFFDNTAIATGVGVAIAAGLWWALREGY